MESALEKEVYLESQHLRVTLPAALSHSLNLGVAYKTATGESGCRVSIDCVAGRCGDLNQAPFIEIQVDAAKNIETVEISRLNHFAEIYLCVLPSTAETDGGSAKLELRLYDGEEKTWLLPFDFTWNQRACLVAKVENGSFMGAKLSRVNHLLDAAALRKTLPGAEKMLELLSPPKPRGDTAELLSDDKSEKKRKSALSASLSGPWMFFKGLFWIVRLALNPIVLAVLLIGGGAIFAMQFLNVIPQFRDWPIIGGLIPAEQTISEYITIHPPTGIDNLFTGFVAMHLIEVKYSNPETRQKPSGYCYKEYEVGFGYQNFTEKIMQDNLEKACTLNDTDLPKPRILTVNSRSGENQGDYSLPECEEWDKNTQIRERKILAKLNSQESLAKLEQNGQKVLGGYLRIYCGIKPGEVK